MDARARAFGVGRPDPSGRAFYHNGMISRRGAWASFLATPGGMSKVDAIMYSAFAVCRASRGLIQVVEVKPSARGAPVATPPPIPDASLQGSGGPGQ